MCLLGFWQGLLNFLSQQAARVIFLRILTDLFCGHLVEILEEKLTGWCETPPRLHTSLVAPTQPLEIS